MSKEKASWSVGIIAMIVLMGLCLCLGGILGCYGIGCDTKDCELEQNKFGCREIDDIIICNDFMMRFNKSEFPEEGITFNIQKKGTRVLKADRVENIKTYLGIYEIKKFANLICKSPQYDCIYWQEEIPNYEVEYHNLTIKKLVKEYNCILNCPNNNTLEGCEFGTCEKDYKNQTCAKIVNGENFRDYMIKNKCGEGIRAELSFNLKAYKKNE